MGRNIFLFLYQNKKVKPLKDRTMRKLKVFASLIWASLPLFVSAQSNDDLYFVPKKKAETKKETVVAPKQNQGTTAYSTLSSSTPVVVKDAAGNTRDVDEYNRRYTSRENTFSMQNDTLYIQEKPYGERGEWVNGFEGSQDDYEYAMRIVRFRSPRYAIPVSSPLYWDVVYGAFPSWDWNVYDDGLYAYIFPTYSNPMWWDWRWNWSIAGPSWGWGWYSPWYYSWYSPWYSPYWYGGYWGGYWGPGWHHHYPYYGWGGGAYQGHSYTYNNRRAEQVVRRGTVGSVFDRNGRTGGRVMGGLDRNSRTGGRVVTGTDGIRSIRPDGASRVRSTGTRYTRPSQGLGESTYSRPSSTRPNSYRNTDVFNRMNQNNSNRMNNGFNNSRTNSSVRSYSNFGGGSYRSTTGGGGSRGISTGGGGGARRR